MIKAIYFTSNSLPIIQRGGKRKALAIAVNINISIERIDQIDSETVVSFEIEEVPVSAVKKLFAQSEDGGPILMAMADGRPVDDDQKAALAEVIARRLRVMEVETA